MKQHEESHGHWDVGQISDLLYDRDDLRIKVKTLREQVAELERWKRVIEDAAVVSKCFTEKNQNDPEKMLKEIVAKISDLLHERDRLRKELKKRAKQLGVACIEHDLTHALACGRCLAEANARIAELEKELTTYEKWGSAIGSYQP